MVDDEENLDKLEDALLDDDDDVIVPRSPSKTSTLAKVEVADSINYEANDFYNQVLAYLTSENNGLPWKVIQDVGTEQNWYNLVSLDDRFVICLALGINE